MKESIKSQNLLQQLEGTKDPLTELLRKSARDLFESILKIEIDEYVKEINSKYQKVIAVRNGYLPERNITTGVGSVSIKQPRVRLKKTDEQIPEFSSAILPRYLRRTPTVDESIPYLYLYGISTNNFNEALSVLLGRDVSGLSSTNIVRLKESWFSEYQAWRKQDLTGKRYVYMWADGVYFNVRLKQERNCILVIIGATEEGKKEVLAIEAGHRESTISWETLLLSLKDRGLEEAPSLAIGDGALGFWSALSKIYPTTKQQRCWVHKTANILDKLPKRLQPEAKHLLHEIYNSDTKKHAEESFDRFLEVYSIKYPSATRCLQRDREELLNFYSFPAEHWLHIRTTNPIESTFSTVRQRMNSTKGCGDVNTTVAMVYKLMMNASKRWKKLNAKERLAEVIDIRWMFVDGIKTRAIAA